MEVLPGHQWLHAGDLVFRHVGREVLRLPGVSRPEIFRHDCLTVQSAMLIAARPPAHAGM